MIAEQRLNVLIEVDGGIDNDTAPIVVEAGARLLVAGSAIFAAPDSKKACVELRQHAEKGLLQARMASQA
jgi:ribulose-phosphate 3-epimerase